MPYINAKWIVPIITVFKFCWNLYSVSQNSIYSDDANTAYNFPMIIFYLFWISEVLQ